MNVEINVEDGERAQSLKKKKRIIIILTYLIIVLEYIIRFIIMELS